MICMRIHNHQTNTGNSPDKLCHTRSVAYSVKLVVLNKHQISGGGGYLDCYPNIKSNPNSDTKFYVAAI